MIDGKKERTNKKESTISSNKSERQNEKWKKHTHAKREKERTIFGQFVQRTVKNQIYLYTHS